MKIKNLIIVLISVITLYLLLISCSPMSFDPRAYNKKNTSMKDDDTLPPDIDIPEDVPEAEDPFKNGEWNDPNYNGFTLDLNKLVIDAVFDSANRPTYKFYNGGNWVLNDAKIEEYLFNGPNSSAGGITVENMKYYQYRGKNSLFPADHKYNESERLKRFYFYRFTGSSAGVTVDNFLIAVDSVSKLVFVSAVPTEWKNMLIKYAPVKWGSVEGGVEASTDNKLKSFKVTGINFFYEYDPVGIVRSDGTVELYSWFTDGIAGNSYSPRIDGSPSDLSREIATYGRPGRSPYLPMQSIPLTSIKVSAKNLKNISVKSRDQKLTGNNGPIQNYGYFVYGIGVSVYEEGKEVQFDILDNINNGNSVPVFSIIDEISKININSVIDFNKSKLYTFENIKEKEIYMELSSSVLKYNRRNGLIGLGPYVDTDRFGSDGSGTMTTKDKPKIKFKYNPANDSFNIVNNENSDNTTITYDSSFSIKKGETKDFTIRYKWMKGNNTTNGEEFEITYTIEFK